jgi:predicted adenine nucleotide alpha hydrolase (AANH) superfamily ATPase
VSWKQFGSELNSGNNFIKYRFFKSPISIDNITSSLGISRWKDMDQINHSGVKAAGHYPNLTYWTFNWRKAGGSERMYQIAKREEFYKQEYCGCIYSLRDTNNWRKINGREEIKIGEEFYNDAPQFSRSFKVS